MLVRRKLEERVEAKQREIQSLERQLAEARVYISAIQEALKLIQRDDSQPLQGASLRAGSDLFRVREALRKEGKPLHLKELLSCLGKQITKGNRVSLAGSLGAYVRRDQIFTRPAPNTFGLVEFDAESPLDEAPPEGFGLPKQTPPPRPSGAP